MDNEFSKLKIGGITYPVKDAQARIGLGEKVDKEKFDAFSDIVAPSASISSLKDCLVEVLRKLQEVNK